MMIAIKGAGDLATGIACRLFQSGFSIVMTETARPTTVRCTVAFSQAVYRGTAQVEGIDAALAGSAQEARALLGAGKIAVLIDPDAQIVGSMEPDAVVDAMLLKGNLATKITDAPIVIGVGPGFTPGTDCHAAVETQRGHDLGRVLWDRSPIPDTGIPGNIEGYTLERILRAPIDGIFTPTVRIGDRVTAGQTVARVDDTPLTAGLTGIVRGLLPTGTPVYAGMKSGDVDPRGRLEYCFSVSDKARAIAGGVLEALLHLRCGRDL